MTRRGLCGTARVRSAGGELSPIMNTTSQNLSLTDPGSHPQAGPVLMIAALGVVFGYIGTSPLYAFKETLNPEHGIPFTPESVLGLLSFVFWGLMFVVTLKYVVFV